MKRIMLVLAFGLILLANLGGDVYALSHPFDLKLPSRERGDEHTWGGDESGGEIRGSAGPTSSFINTGFIHLDFFVNGVLGYWWFPDDTPTGQTGKTTYIVVPLRNESDEVNLEVNSNNKGN